MIKKYIFIFVILILIFSFVVLQNFLRGYEVKIELKINDISPRYLNDNIAEYFKNQLLQNKDIKDVVVFSSKYGCNIYCKINPLKVFKNNLIEDIKLLVNADVSNFKEIDSYKINDEFDLKYSHFILLKHSSYDYFSFKCQADKLLNDLLNLKISKNILPCAQQQMVNYIYFSENDLLNFDINIAQIKKYINDNNLNLNYLSNVGKFNSSNFNLNGNIQNIEDLKNIRINFKNSSFSVSLGEIFFIEEDTQKIFDDMVFYRNAPVLLFAIAKKSFLPDFVIDFKLKKLKKMYNFEVIKPNKYKKIEFYLSDNSIQKDSLEFCKKYFSEFKNSLFFIGSESLKTSNKFNFDEIISNRIQVLCLKNDFFKIKKILDELNISYFKEDKYFVYDKNIEKLNLKILELSPDIYFGLKKANVLNYKFIHNRLNQYNISKDDVLNAIKTNNNGLLIGKYKRKLNDVEIILKNKNYSSENYLYSKKYKSLVDVNMFLMQDITSDYLQIAQKNGTYFAILKFKNPSVIRRVKLQIRHLLSLFNLSI